MGVSASTLERKTYVLYVMGVSTAIPSQRKLYMLYIEGVWSPYLFKRKHCFLICHILYVCDYTSAILKNL